MSEALLSVERLSVTFDIHQNKRFPWSEPQKLHAVSDVSFELEKGTTLGVVGESGCGKSTLIRAICGLVTPTGGRVRLNGQEINYQDRAALLAARQQMQMIFQDPIASLSPRMNVREIVTEPLRLNKVEGDHAKMVKDMLDKVGIAERNLNRYPHEFSGGQCQRIGIARALITRPKILLCDEPVSALDVSIQAQVVNLLNEIQAEMGLTLIFVAHDLGIIRHISDQVLVMYLGGIMEFSDTETVVGTPMHPYTKALLSAVPIPNPRRKLSPEILVGDLPSPLDPPKGCLFSTRCPEVDEGCLIGRPAKRQTHDREITCVKVVR